jgi:hypothetical protein
MITDMVSRSVGKNYPMYQPTSKTGLLKSNQLKKVIFRSCIALLLLLAVIPDGSMAQAQPLWQIGKADHSAAEFALAKNGYTSFLQQFGSPDHAFYIPGQVVIPTEAGIR